MEIKQIRHFLSVYKRGSFTSAADHLGVSQPAISYSIKKLESELDARLFVYQNGQLHTTRRAHELAPKFEHALEILDVSTTQRSELHGYIIEPLIYHLSSHPQLVMHEPPVSQEQLELDLDKDKVDLAIDVIRISNPSFINELLYNEKLVLVCRQDHPRVQGSLTLEQFYRESHVLYQPRRLNLNAMRFQIQELGKRSTRAEVSSISSVLMTTSTSDLLGACPYSVACHWKEQFGVQILDFPIELPTLPVYMTYHKRNQADPFHTRVRESLKSQLLANINATP